MGAAQVCYQADRPNIGARDICLPAPEKPGEYAHLLAESLQGLGIRARDEVQLQDLLAEPLTQATIAVLRLGLHERHPASWGTAMALLEQVHGLEDDDPGARLVATDRGRFTRRLEDNVRAGDADVDTIRSHLRSVVAFFGEEAFRRVYLQYLQSDFFENTLNAISAGLADSHGRTGDWIQTLDDFEGEDAIHDHL